MARRRVTYLEVADERPGRSGAGRPVLDLERVPSPAGPCRPPIRPQRRACPAWLAQLALVGLLASGVALDRATTGPDEQAALDRAADRRRPEIELSSDLLRPAELLDAALAMDLDRLMRTAAPRAGAPGQAAADAG